MWNFLLFQGLQLNPWETYHVPVDHYSHMTVYDCPNPGSSRLHPDKMYDHLCGFGHGVYEIPAICKFGQFPVRNCLENQLICHE